MCTVTLSDQAKVLVQYSIVLYSLLAFIQNGCTALHIASRNGHFEVVIMLLKAKAAVNIKTSVSYVDCAHHVLCVCTLNVSLLIIVNCYRTMRQLCI